MTEEEREEYLEQMQASLDSKISSARSKIRNAKIQLNNAKRILDQSITLDNEGLESKEISNVISKIDR